MANARKIRVTLPERLKAGGKIWPKGMVSMPLDLVEALEDEQEGGDVLLVQRATDEVTPPEPAGDLLEGLTADEVSAVKTAIAALKPEDIKDGVPKVGAVNDALAAAEAGVKVTGKQIAAVQTAAD